ncbi:DUF2029 domain-containing protein [Escherichia coli]|nr:DUF2029 domain-containing protein [Escherichia coli]EKK2330536.1 DUF2029 domain-containing protein [Escherichia coli]MDA6792061.1 glycosyltransferase 87 family protein [Escherichia coli]
MIELPLYLYVVYCFAFGMIFFVIGNIVLSSFFKEGVAGLNKFSLFFYCLCIGMSLSILIIYFLGMVGQFNKIAIFLIFTVCWVLSIIKRQQFRWLAINNIEFSTLCVILFLVLIFAVTLLSSLRAPGDWDDTMYHLPLARSLVEHHAIVVEQYLRFPLFPQNADLLMALGLQLGDVRLAQFLANICFFVIACGLVGCSWEITKTYYPGIIATILLFTINPLKDHLGYAYIDLTLSLFCFAAASILIYIRSENNKTQNELIFLCGFFIGIACGVKLFGAIYGVIIFVILIAKKRNIQTFLIFSLATILGGIYWYVRSFWISGDPFSPAGGNIFGHYLWNEIDLQVQTAEQARHGISPATLDLQQAINKVGSDVVFYATLSVFTLRNNKILWVFFSIVLTYVLFWFSVTQVDRYLSPIYPLSVLLVAISIASLIKDINITNYKLGRYFILACIIFFRGDRCILNSNIFILNT